MIFNRSKFTLVLLFLISCNNSEKSNESTNHHEVNSYQKKKIENEKTTGISDPFLDKFEKINFETLKVFYSSSSLKFKGKRLNAWDIKKIDTEKRFAQYPSDCGFYACYQFKFDQSTIGLIIRTPSEYESSSIKLFLYQIASSKISKPIELAELFGDAGSFLDKESWIIKTRNKKTKVLIKSQEFWDHSVDDGDSIFVETWNEYYLVEFDKRNWDTIHKDSTFLHKKYGRLLSKRKI